MEPKYTFRKAEKLTNKKIIEELFSKGSSFFVYPYRFSFSLQPAFSIHQVLISVPKRKFKRSVDRHWIQRRIRESYRLNKHLIRLPSQVSQGALAIAIVYVGKDKEPFSVCESKLKSCIQRLNRTMAEENLPAGGDLSKKRSSNRES